MRRIDGEEGLEKVKERITNGKELGKEKTKI